MKKKEKEKEKPNLFLIITLLLLMSPTTQCHPHSLFFYHFVPGIENSIMIIIIISNISSNN